MSEYTRTITAHEVPNASPSGIVLTADERDANNGNTSHKYLCSWQESGEANLYEPIFFQEGPIKEVGINGITNELLLAIVIDRLEGFQSGPYACEENAAALASTKNALSMLQFRTMRRIERGVEGTYEK